MAEDEAAADNGASVPGGEVHAYQTASTETGEVEKYDGLHMFLGELLGETTSIDNLPSGGAFVAADSAKGLHDHSVHHQSNDPATATSKEAAQHAAATEHSLLAENNAGNGSGQGAEAAQTPVADASNDQLLFPSAAPEPDVCPDSATFASTAMHGHTAPDSSAVPESVQATGQELVAEGSDAFAAAMTESQHPFSSAGLVEMWPAHDSTLADLPQDPADFLSPIEGCSSTDTSDSSKREGEKDREGDVDVQVESTKVPANGDGDGDGGGAGAADADGDGDADGQEDKAKGKTNVKPIVQCTRELYFNFKKHLEEQQQLRQDRQRGLRGSKDGDASKASATAAGNVESSGGADKEKAKKGKVSLPVVGKVLTAAARLLWAHVEHSDGARDALQADFRDFQTSRKSKPQVAVERVGTRLPHEVVPLLQKALQIDNVSESWGLKRFMVDFLLVCAMGKVKSSPMLVTEYTLDDLEAQRAKHAAERAAATREKRAKARQQAQAQAAQGTPAANGTASNATGGRISSSVQCSSGQAAQMVSTCVGHVETVVPAALAAQHPMHDPGSMAKETVVAGLESHPVMATHGMSAPLGVEVKIDPSAALQAADHFPTSHTAASAAPAADGIHAAMAHVSAQAAHGLESAHSNAQSVSPATQGAPYATAVPTGAQPAPTDGPSMQFLPDANGQMQYAAVHDQQHMQQVHMVAHPHQAHQQCVTHVAMSAVQLAAPQQVAVHHSTVAAPQMQPQHIPHGAPQQVPHPQVSYAQQQAQAQHYSQQYAAHATHATPSLAPQHIQPDVQAAYVHSSVPGVQQAAVPQQQPQQYSSAHQPQHQAQYHAVAHSSHPVAGHQPHHVQQVQQYPPAQHAPRAQHAQHAVAHTQQAAAAGYAPSGYAHTQVQYMAQPSHAQASEWSAARTTSQHSQGTQLLPEWTGRVSAEAAAVPMHATPPQPDTMKMHVPPQQQQADNSSHMGGPGTTCVAAAGGQEHAQLAMQHSTPSPGPPATTTAVPTQAQTMVTMHVQENAAQYSTHTVEGIGNDQGGGARLSDPGAAVHLHAVDANGATAAAQAEDTSHMCTSAPAMGHGGYEQSTVDTTAEAYAVSAHQHPSPVASHQETVTVQAAEVLPSRPPSATGAGATAEYWDVQHAAAEEVEHQQPAAQPAALAPATLQTTSSTLPGASAVPSSMETTMKPLQAAVGASPWEDAHAPATAVDVVMAQDAVPMHEPSSVPGAVDATTEVQLHRAVSGKEVVVSTPPQVAAQDAPDAQTWASAEEWPSHAAQQQQQVGMQSVASLADNAGERGREAGFTTPPVAGGLADAVDAHAQPAIANEAAVQLSHGVGARAVSDAAAHLSHSHSLPATTAQHQAQHQPTHVAHVHVQNGEAHNGMSGPGGTHSPVPHMQPHVATGARKRKQGAGAIGMPGAISTSEKRARPTTRSTNGIRVPPVPLSPPATAAAAPRRRTITDQKAADILIDIARNNVPQGPPGRAAPSLGRHAVAGRGGGAAYMAGVSRGRRATTELDIPAPVTAEAAREGRVNIGGERDSLFLALRKHLPKSVGNLQLSQMSVTNHVLKVVCTASLHETFLTKEVNTDVVTHLNIAVPASRGSAVVLPTFGLVTGNREGMMLAVMLSSYVPTANLKKSQADPPQDMRTRVKKDLTAILSICSRHLPRLAASAPLPTLSSEDAAAVAALNFGNELRSYVTLSRLLHAWRVDPAIRPRLDRLTANPRTMPPRANSATAPVLSSSAPAGQPLALASANVSMDQDVMLQAHNSSGAATVRGSASPPAVPGATGGTPVALSPSHSGNGSAHGAGDMANAAQTSATSADGHVTGAGGAADSRSVEKGGASNGTSTGASSASYDSRKVMLAQLIVDQVREKTSAVTAIQGLSDQVEAILGDVGGTGTLEGVVSEVEGKMKALQDDLERLKGVTESVVKELGEGAERDQLHVVLGKLAASTERMNDDVAYLVIGAKTMISEKLLRDLYGDIFK